MKLRSLVVAGVAAATLLVPSTSAMAVGTTDTVSGTTLGSLALAVGVNPGFGTTLRPGASLTNNGTLIATSTNPVWTLNVKDASATTAGKMDAATPGLLLCAGSADNLASSLNVAVTASGAISDGVTAISGSDQPVIHTTAEAPLPIAATTLNTSYTQAIGAAEVLTAGCVYSLTATYTIQ
jgi:hypothetical protein